jgi:catechol 2,3-dioxygenase-like lactoylglutathione lyase family enzyme
MSATFSHLALTDFDLDRQRDFYCSVFGFRASTHGFEGTGRRLSKLMEVDGAEIQGLFLRKDGFVLELLNYRSVSTQPGIRGDDEAGYSHLSFVVDDMDDTASLVTAHGGEFRSAGRDRFEFQPGCQAVMAFCLDPERNRIELIWHGDAAARAAHGTFLGAGELGWPLGR